MTRLHFPSEILFTIGQYLNGPSLYACLQVCHQWNLALFPLAWVLINKQQWSHRSFPIQPSTRLSPPFNTKDEEINAAKLLSCLQQTRSFEWSDTRPARPLGQRRTTLSLGHLSLPSLEIFRSMPRLVRLSLVTGRDSPSIDSILSILNSPNLLSNLRALSLDFATFPLVLETERLYTLFSRLEELDLCGNICFSPPSMSSPSFFRGAPTAGLSSIQVEQELQPWRVKLLTVQCLNIHILEKCLVLEHLVVKDPFMARDWEGNDSNPRQQILTQLQRLPNLKAMEIGRWTKWSVKDKFSRVPHDGRGSLGTGGSDGSGGGALWKRMVVKTKTKWTATKTIVTTTTVSDPQETDWTLAGIVNFFERGNDSSNFSALLPV